VEIIIRHEVRSDIEAEENSPRTSEQILGDKDEASMG